MHITPQNIGSQQQLITSLTQFFLKYSNPAILCIGNSKVIGDAFAPFLGEILLTKYNLPVHIYGRKHKNVTSSNLVSYISTLKQFHDGILVVDSTFTNLSTLGTLTIIPYGCVVDYLHNPTKIGDYSLLANVNTYSLTSLTQITKVKKEMILHLLAVASNAIYKAYTMAKTYQSIF